MDASLASFGTGDAKPTGGLSGVANAAYLTDPPERENVKAWKQASTEYGLVTHQVAGRSTGGHSHRAAEHEVRWVSGGDLAGYVQEHGDKLLSLPETYSGFSGGAFDPYLSCIDGLLEDHYGYGISGTGVERALRILNDNGRYQASKYHIIAANEHPWILTGPKGVVLCSPVPVERTSANSRTVPVEFTETTIPVEEENTIVLTALRRIEAYLAGKTPTGAPDSIATDTLDSLPLTFADHGESPTSSKLGGTDQHIFNTQADGGGTSVRIEREDFHDLGTMVLDPKDLPGVPEPATVNSPSGSSITIDHAPKREVAETYAEGVVIGYSFDWEVFPYSPEEVATVTTYHMSPSEHGEETLSIGINRTKNRVKTTSVHYSDN